MCQEESIQSFLNVPDFDHPRLHDTEIMQVFISTGYRGGDLATLNQCQMFLHAIFITALCTATGTKMEICKWTKLEQLPSKLHWPATPTSTHRNQIDLLACSTHQSSPSRSSKFVCHPLGPWVQGTTPSEGRYYDEEGSMLYQFQDSRWTQ